MNFTYEKNESGKYTLYGLNDIKDYNACFLELYNRFERSVVDYGYLKYNRKISILDLETYLRENGFGTNAEKLANIRKTRNILVHGDATLFTINPSAIKTLVSLVIDREEKVKALKTK